MWNPCFSPAAAMCFCNSSIEKEEDNKSSMIVRSPKRTVGGALKATFANSSCSTTPSTNLRDSLFVGGRPIPPAPGGDNTILVVNVIKQKMSVAIKKVRLLLAISSSRFGSFSLLDASSRTRSSGSLPAIWRRRYLLIISRTAALRTCQSERCHAGRKRSRRLTVVSLNTEDAERRGATAHFAVLHDALISKTTGHKSCVATFWGGLQDYLF